MSAIWSSRTSGKSFRLNSKGVAGVEQFDPYADSSGRDFEAEADRLEAQADALEQEAAKKEKAAPAPAGDELGSDADAYEGGDEGVVDAPPSRSRNAADAVASSARYPGNCYKEPLPAPAGRA